MNYRSTNRRLQLATRIHYALLRELGHGIDIGRLLKQPLYARDVLLVCDACEGNDLQRLARAYRGALQEALDAGASGTTTSAPASWSRWRNSWAVSAARRQAHSGSPASAARSPAAAGAGVTLGSKRRAPALGTNDPSRS